MADFCRQCSIRDFPDVDYEEFGDLMGLCDPGQTTIVICEGCGGTVPVDYLGNCMIHEECERQWAEWFAAERRNRKSAE